MIKQYATICALACMVACLTGCGRPSAQAPAREKMTTEAGRRINLTLREARPDGSVIELDQYVNQAVLLNVWATWSQPCREECALINKLYEKYRDRGLVAVGVLTDNTDEQEAVSLVQSLNLVYPNGWVDALSAQAPFDTMRVIPTKYFLNRRHELVGVSIEGIATEADLQRRIEELL